MYSARIPGNLAANRLSEAIARSRQQGRSLLDLTLSNPTRAGFDYPADLLAPLGSSAGLSYEPHPLGLLRAREAVADDFRRRGQDVPAARIALTASTSDAYSLLFKVLCDPGDHVLVPRPSYPLFEHLTRLDGLASDSYTLDYHGAWSLDVDSVARAITPRTKAVLAVSPNNPTGSYLQPRELDALAALCRPAGIAIVVDEVFADYELAQGAAAQSAQVLGRDDVLVFSLGGLSKSVGLPQVKLGWIAVAGAEAAVQTALDRIEFAADAYLSVSTPVQHAAPDLLQRGAGIRRQIQRRIHENLQSLAAQLQRTPSCRLLDAAGGWYAVVQVPSLMTEEDLTLGLLEDDGVLVHPGYFFDFPHESFLVVSLLPPADVFAAGVSRILRRFDSHPA